MALVFSIAAMLIGIVGLAALAPRLPVVEMKIKDIGPQGENPFLNYATIRVKGEVISVPLVSISQGRISLYFTISDETGSIDVRAYDPVASQMIKEGKVPLPGDIFIGEVQVRVRETYSYLIIQGINLFEIKTRSEDVIEVTSLSLNIPQGTLVRATGRATNLRNVSAGWLFDLQTSGGTITVLVPTFVTILDTRRASFAYNNISIGAELTITGVVYHYRGTTPEIVVRKLEDIVIKTPAVQPGIPPGLNVVKLRDLARYVNSMVLVSVTLRGLGYESGTQMPYIIYVYDDTGNGTVRANTTLVLRINPMETATGSVLNITGTVRILGGNIVIEANNIIVVKKEPPKVLNISYILENFDEYMGMIVGIRGSLTDYRTTSGGSYIITFSDNTGEITVFIPRSAWDRIQQNIQQSILNRETVTFYGYLTLYGTTPELVVYHASGVEV
ncbi:MAG: hypothetical protein QXT88_01725 [Desulfurococcaceae archaeon]